MNKNLFVLLTLPLLLSGCVGSQIWGSAGYSDENFPDIRTVPGRQEALATRGLHKEDEKVSRRKDLKQLEQEREEIKARDQALRKKAFPTPS